MATVVVSPQAQRQFHALPTPIRTRIEKVYARLQKWPAVSGVKALSGNLAGHYRIRTGDYRVQFRVVPGITAGGSGTTDQLLVEKIGHRDRFYED